MITVRGFSWIPIFILSGTFDNEFLVVNVLLINTLFFVTVFLLSSSSLRSFTAASINRIRLTKYRVGGNFQDLVTRSLCGAMGAIWGGLSYAAGNGNPYVMAVFAVIYMVPFLYRFTRSSHPRSGIVGRFLYPIIA